MTYPAHSFRLSPDALAVMSGKTREELPSALAESAFVAGTVTSVCDLYKKTSMALAAHPEELTEHRAQDALAGFLILQFQVLSFALLNQSIRFLVLADEAVPPRQVRMLQEETQRMRKTVGLVLSALQTLIPEREEVLRLEFDAVRQTFEEELNAPHKRNGSGGLVGKVGETPTPRG